MTVAASISRLFSRTQPKRPTSNSARTIECAAPCLSIADAKPIITEALMRPYPKGLLSNNALFTDVPCKTLRLFGQKEQLPEMPLPDFPTMLLEVASIEDRYDKEPVQITVKQWGYLPNTLDQQPTRVIATYKGVAIGIYNISRWSLNTATQVYTVHGSEARPELWVKYIGQHGMNATRLTKKAKY